MNEDRIHLWQNCHHCGLSPIIGTRYHCVSCPEGPDSDLCEDCFSLYSAGNILHPAPEYRISNRRHDFVKYDGKPRDLYEKWINIKTLPVHSIKIESGLLMRPEFCCDRESYYGAHGFLVNTDKEQIFLTALHVLDELIKAKQIDTTARNKNYSGMELPNLITGVNLYDVLEQQWMYHLVGQAGPMLCLQDARTADEEPISYRDIAAFYVVSADGHKPYIFAKSTPSVGEPVWLAARSEMGEHTHQAVVVEKTEQTFVFKYNDSSRKLRATSGAPILNGEKEIVGINVGGGQYRGCKFGHANHVENIRWHLNGFFN